MKEQLAWPTQNYQDSAVSSALITGQSIGPNMPPGNEPRPLASWNPSRQKCDPGDIITTPQLPQPPHLNLHGHALYLRSLGNRLIQDGQLKAAEAHFGQSLMILKQLTPKNGKHLQPLRDQGERSLKDANNYDVYLRDLILAYHSLGRVLELMGRLDESQVIFRHAVQATSRLTATCRENFDWHRGLASSCGHLGRVLLAQGVVDEARENLAENVSIMRRLVDRQPRNSAWRYALACAWHNLALILEKMKRALEALEGYQEEIALMQQLVEENPRNDKLALTLATVYGITGRLLHDLSQIEKAQQSTENYVGLMRAITQHHPDDLALNRELSIAIGQMGRLQELAGLYNQALNCFQEVVSIRKALTRHKAANGDIYCDLASGLCKTGDIYLATQGREEAKRCYHEALEVLENIGQKPCQDSTRQAETCGVLYRLGNCYKNEDQERSKSCYKRALVLAAAQRNLKGGRHWNEMVTTIKSCLKD